MLNRITQLLSVFVSGIRCTTGASLLGRIPSGAGPVQEIPLGDGLAFTGGALAVTGKAASSHTHPYTEITGLMLAGTPTNGVAATCALDPAGADNHILLEAVESGVGGNDLTAEIIIKDDSFSVLTNVFLVGNAIEIRAGSKYRMVVSDTGLPGFAGTYVSTYTDTVPLSGKGDYLKVGSATTRIAWILGDDKWVLQDLFIAGDRWESYEDVATPDLVTTWTPVGAASGSPVVTASTATADQVYTLINSELSASVIATLLPADVYGPVAAVAETPFTGGADPSAATSLFMIDSDYLYSWTGSAASPTWKKSERASL